MKSRLNTLLFVLFLFTAVSGFAQSRIDRRALQQRGNDSAWIYDPFLARTRFYLGEKRVTPLEFHNALRSSDQQVSQLIDESLRRRRTAGIILGAGAVSGLVGLLIMNGGDNYLETPPASIALIIAGSVMEIAGEIVILGAANRYRDAIRMFNNKARKGTLNSNVRIGLGATRNGMGLVVHF
jgi:hypothetical protein